VSNIPPFKYRDQLKEEKMRRLKVALLIMLGVIFTHNLLFSTIYGRVEGVIRDKDTGKGIVNVEVILCWMGSDMEKTTTGKDGKFVFKKVEPHQDYFIGCFADDYIPNVPKYLRRNVFFIKDNPAFREAACFFDLKEGEIKYPDISLEKGGKIKGKIVVKDATVIKPYNHVYISLFKQYEEGDFYKTGDYFGGVSIASKYTSNNGEFIFNGLKPTNTYILIIRPQENFARRYIKDIEIRKNETVFFNFTFDLSKLTVIKGTVTKNGVPLNSVYITFLKMPKNEIFAVFETYKNGKYLILMTEPGYYRVKYCYFDTDKVEHIKEIMVKIDADELKIIDIEF
jgi:hypothetical protein